MLLEEISSYESFKFFVFDLLRGACLESCSVVWQSSGDNLGRLGKDDDGALEVGNVFSFLFYHYGIGLDELVVDALTNANLGTSLVFESSEGEWECWEALADFREESS